MRLAGDPGPGRTKHPSVHEVETQEKSKENLKGLETQRLQDTLVRAGALQFVILKCNDIG